MIIVRRKQPNTDDTDGDSLGRNLCFGGKLLVQTECGSEVYELIGHLLRDRIMPCYT